jgi:hypothetical protein
MRWTRRIAPCGGSASQRASPCHGSRPTTRLPSISAVIALVGSDLSQSSSGRPSTAQFVAGRFVVELGERQPANHAAEREIRRDRGSIEHAASPRPVFFRPRFYTLSRTE